MSSRSTPLRRAWWEPLKFEVQEPGEWDVVLSTVAETEGPLAPRSIRVLRKSAQAGDEP